MNKIEGFLFINKPKGANSFRCVAQIRRVLGQKKLKVGYAGTLDPFAHGLMIIGIGRKATRLLHHITKWDKQYIATAKLGELTDTLDPTGTIIATNTITVSKYDLHQTIANFPKTYEQTPPIYCALKHKGVPLYKLARHKGKTEQDLQEVLHKKSRTVHLHSIELLNAQKPFFTIQTHVSHGTYIRTLVNDIARIHKSCATTHELQRTAIGKIPLSDAIELDPIQTPEIIETNLVPVELFLERHFEQNH